jgi:hypothetical protein
MQINDQASAALLNIAKIGANLHKNGEFEQILEALSSNNLDSLSKSANLDNLANLNLDSQLNQAINSAQNMANSDSKLFATFDFMQAMNQLLYGNPSDAERSKLLSKMQEIANNI